MSILVTGGAGYIGSHAVRQLKRSGFETLVLDNLSYGHREFVEAGELIVGDLSDSLLLKNLFHEHRIDAVMHFAAYAQVEESVKNPALYYRNNTFGTLNLLDAMIAAHVKHIIFSSTCATYGEPKQVPVTEDHPQSPINPYGRTKWMSEKILMDYGAAYGLKSIIFRYFNAAGADPDGGIGEDHNPEASLIPLVLDAALGRRKEITIFGNDYDTPDGTCVRDYIHVTDLADAHVRALKFLMRENESHCLNLGNGNGFSVKQVIDTAQNVTGRSIKMVQGPRREGDPALLVGSSDKAKKFLDWKPQFTDLASIIETAWIWHQKRFGH
jgi:UDP-glucose 4-epimerase